MIVFGWGGGLFVAIDKTLCVFVCYFFVFCWCFVVWLVLWFVVSGGVCLDDLWLLSAQRSG